MEHYVENASELRRLFPSNNDGAGSPIVARDVNGNFIEHVVKIAGNLDLSGTHDYRVPPDVRVAIEGMGVRPTLSSKSNLWDSDSNELFLVLKGALVAFRNLEFEGGYHGVQELTVEGGRDHSGVRITGARASFANCTISGWPGTGISAEYNGTQVEITNSILRRCRQYRKGACIRVARNANVKVEKSTFTEFYTAIRSAPLDGNGRGMSTEVHATDNIFVTNQLYQESASEQRLGIPFLVEGSSGSTPATEWYGPNMTTPALGPGDAYSTNPQHKGGNAGGRQILERNLIVIHSDTGKVVARTRGEPTHSFSFINNRIFHRRGLSPTVGIPKHADQQKYFIMGNEYLNEDPLPDLQLEPMTHEL